MGNAVRHHRVDTREVEVVAAKYQAGTQGASQVGEGTIIARPVARFLQRQL